MFAEYPDIYVVYVSIAKNSAVYSDHLLHLRYRYEKVIPDSYRTVYCMSFYWTFEITDVYATIICYSCSRIIIKALLRFPRKWDGVGWKSKRKKEICVIKQHHANRSKRNKCYKNESYSTNIVDRTCHLDCQAPVG